MTQDTRDKGVWGFVLWLAVLGHSLCVAPAWGEEAASKAHSGSPSAVTEGNKTAVDETKETGKDAKPDPEDTLHPGRWIKFRDGKWRIEATADGGIHSQEDHSGDHLIVAKVEYEMPVMAHGALGVRLVPIFALAQDDNDTVWGAGAGLVTRLYQVKGEQRGFFVEAEAQLAAHHPKFEGNSGTLNVLTGLGAGYKLKNRWHAVLKFDHISNADIAKRNGGYNGFGIGIGYTF